MSLLEGTRVIDLGRIIAGPMTGMLLGDLGAEVIKVETGPAGDFLRNQEPTFGPGLGGYFATGNRNKRSLHIDLRAPGGRKVLEALMRSADVLIENFRPGVFDRQMGFTDEVLARDYPELVVARISAYGDIGPKAHQSGLDQMIQGLSGLMAVTGTEDSGPVRSGIAVCDVMGALNATIGILAALQERGRSGRGQVMRTSLLEATLAMMSVQAGKFFASGEDPVCEGNHHPVSSPYGMYETADGCVQIMVSKQENFRHFAELCGRQDWLEDPRFADSVARSVNKHAMRETVAEAMRARATAEWIELLEAADIPCGPVLSVQQAFEHPQAEALGMTLSMTSGGEHAVRTPGFPWRHSRTPASLRHPVPMMGEHSDQIVAELGLAHDPEVRAALAGKAGG